MTNQKINYKPQRLIFVILVIFAILVIPLVKADFPDVSSSHSNFNAINYVQEQEIVKGYDDGTYQPNKRINRAEFTKIIVNATKTNISGSNCFPDLLIM